MKDMIRALSALVAIIALTVFFAMTDQSVHAQSAALTQDQIDRIKSNCTSIKGSLNQLHASDALLRVNRGQVYESMASKLMDPFNGRLSNNRLDSKATSVVTTSYRTALDNFRNDYINYEEKLSGAIKIDCTTQAENFYAATEQARTLRAKVHEDVLKLNQYIDDFRSAVSDFLLNYERVSE